MPPPRKPCLALGLSSRSPFLLDIEKELQGDKVKGEVGERSNPNASEGSSLSWRAFGNTYGPTEEHKAFLSRVQSQLKKVKAKLLPIVNSTLPALENDLKKAGAPWIEGCLLYTSPSPRDRG